VKRLTEEKKEEKPKLTGDEIKKLAEMDEEEFLKEHSEAKRHPEIEGLTARAYETEEYLWLFDKFDGHLAWKYEKKTNKELYACEHIKLARRTFFRRISKAYETDLS